MYFQRAIYFRIACAPPDELRIAQSTALVRHLPAVVVCNGVSVLAFVAMAARAHPLPRYLPVFVVAFMLLLAPLWMSWVKLRRLNPPAHVSARRIRSLNLYSLVLGLAWAVFGIMSLPFLPLALGLCAAAGLLAMSVYALTGFAFLPLGCLGFALPVFGAAMWSMHALMPASPFSGAVLVLMCFVELIGAGFMYLNWRQFVEDARRDALARLSALSHACSEGVDSAMKSRFVRAASHDLGQPIHALSLYLGTLAQKALPAEAHAVVSDARDCVQHMSEMFRDLLHLSRLDMQKVEPQYADTPIDTILEIVKAEYEPLAHAKSLSFRSRASQAVVRTDPVIAGQIVSNLVSNAIRYSMRGGVLVACRKRQKMLRVEVYDTGPGIEESQTSAIFEEFYRAGSAHEPRAGVTGLGLGLTVARRLASTVGASIGMRSRPGRGSCFYVDFPNVLPAPCVAPHLSEVVVVHHEPAALEPAISSLRQSGFSVVSGLSSADVLEHLQARSRAPDAIVCTDRLPDGQSGVQAIEAVRKEFNMDIPALLIRSHEVSVAEDCREQELGLMVIDRLQAASAIGPAVTSLLGLGVIARASRQAS